MVFQTVALRIPYFSLSLSFCKWISFDGFIKTNKVIVLPLYLNSSIEWLRLIQSIRHNKHTHTHCRPHDTKYTYIPACICLFNVYVCMRFVGFAVANTLYNRHLPVLFCHRTLNSTFTTNTRVQRGKKY